MSTQDRKLSKKQFNILSLNIVTISLIEIKKNVKVFNSLKQRFRANTVIPRELHGVQGFLNLRKLHKGRTQEEVARLKNYLQQINSIHSTVGLRYQAPK